MITWLNNNLGTDAATYIGLGFTIIGLFWIGSKVFNIIVNKKNIKTVNGTKNKIQDQTLNVGSGNGFQSGGNMKINIGSINSSEHKEKTEKKSHDLRIIEELVKLLPYEDILHHVELSSISGMPFDIARALEKAEGFNEPNYKLYNLEVESAKLKFLSAANDFMSVCNVFLSVDHINIKPKMVEPPFNWKNGPREEKFREQQLSLSDKAIVLIEEYKKFVEVYKIEGFISEKI